MTNFVRNSRLKRLTSAICAVAMIATMVVLPASANPGPVFPTTVVGSPSFGTSSFTSVAATCATGLQGVVSIYTTGTPGLYADSTARRHNS